MTFDKEGALRSHFNRGDLTLLPLSNASVNVFLSFLISMSIVCIYLSMTSRKALSNPWFGHVYIRYRVQ